ncbi:MAG: hypothetical protein HYU38_06790, partial [Candidatus Tectomicrobia bacterium]|nr:hypothetical protein [Candidatus Tectomicrobia bacterium]
MRPRLRRTRWRGAAAYAGGLLLVLAAGLPAARAQGPPPLPLLLLDDLDVHPEAGPQARRPPGARALPASFARHDGEQKRPFRLSKTKRQPLQGLRLARLEPPPAPPGPGLRGQRPENPRPEAAPYEAHAPPGDSGAEIGKAAEARLLLLYSLLPEPGAARAPGPRLSIFAEEIPSKADADETLWRMIAKTSASGGGTSELRFIGENAQLLALPASFSPGDAPVQANRQE